MKRVKPVGHRDPLKVRRKHGGGRVQVWAAIIKHELVGPFSIEDELIFSSRIYCQILDNTSFSSSGTGKSLHHSRRPWFYSGQCSITGIQAVHCTASRGLKDGRIMIWLPSSLDLNPTENLWALLKCEVDSEGRQHSSLNSVWCCCCTKSWSANSSTN